MPLWSGKALLAYSRPCSAKGIVMRKRLAERRERKEQEREQGRQQQADAATRERIAELRESVDEIEDSIAFYSDIENAFDEISDEAPIVTKKGEEVILIAQGLALVEVRRGKATYSGGSRGVSVRVAKGVSLRVGSHRGTMQPAPEKPTIIDSGDFVVTNKRAVFVGDKHTRAFEWSKILACNEYAHDGHVLFMLPVENRQRVSGVAALPVGAEILDERIKFGIAMFQDRRDDFIDGLQVQADRERVELEELEAASSTPLDTA